jgi:hypothetical protein
MHSKWPCRQPSLPKGRLYQQRTWEQAWTEPESTRGCKMVAQTSCHPHTRTCPWALTMPTQAGPFGPSAEDECTWAQHSLGELQAGSRGPGAQCGGTALWA